MRVFQIFSGASGYRGTLENAFSAAEVYSAVSDHHLQIIGEGMD